jgi:hypothetical protein
MKKRIIAKVVVIFLAIALSLFLAFCGAGIESQFSIRTPGTIAAPMFVHPKFVGDFAAVGTYIEAQILIDWIFWFVVFSVSYFLLVKVVSRSRR